MPQPISNLAQSSSSSGLLPLSPFLGAGNSNTQLTSTPSTGISTPKPNVSPTAPSYGILGTPGSTTTNTAATPNLGGLLSSYAPTSSYAPASGSLNATPGQGYQQYEAAQGFPQGASTQTTPQNTPNQGLGTGGGAAPAGMSYNGQGQLVATSSLPSGTAPQTFNTNPYNATAPAYSGTVGALAGTASQPSAAFTQAQNTAQTALQQLEASQSNEANANAANQSNPIPLEFQQGRGQVLQNQYNAQQQALANEYQGAVGLEGAATSQQGTQQSGLAGAAGLSAPQPANALGTYNPTTGQYEQYGGGTGGGAAAAGGVQTQVQQGAAVQSMEGIYQQAQGLASTLTQAINQSGYNPAQGVGPANTYANGVNDWLQKNSGNPQYQNVANLVSEVANKYAAILNQSGGTPTSVSQVQQQIINGLASGQQIEQVLGSLATNAQTSINALQSASQNNANNGTTGNSNTNSQYSW